LSMLSPLLEPSLVVYRPRAVSGACDKDFSENVRQYKTLDSKVFSVRNPRMRISSFFYEVTDKTAPVP
jgi:hypothetical protein